MTPYDFVHLTLLAVGGKIDGSTKLQKTVYFMGLLTGYLEKLGYRPHYYGPYSDTVAAATNRLKALGFVHQSSLHMGGVNRFGFEVQRHDFELTEEGKAVVEKKRSDNPITWGQIAKAAARFKDANPPDYMKMSVAAKTIFMLHKADRPTTTAELSKFAQGLGWNIEPGEIEQSVQFLQDLGLLEGEKVVAPVKPA